VPEFVDDLRDLNVTSHIDAEHEQPDLGDRCSHEPAIRLCDQPTESQANRGAVRLGRHHPGTDSRDIDNRPKSGDLQVSAPYNFNIKPAMARPDLVRRIFLNEMDPRHRLRKSSALVLIARSIRR
jgi:hypothetical protein